MLGYSHLPTYAQTSSKIAITPQTLFLPMGTTNMMATLMCLLLLLLNLTIALPNPVPIDSASETSITARSDNSVSEYCFTGWAERDYKGKSETICCKLKCCYFESILLNNLLSSAKATVSPGLVGVRLWTSWQCNGKDIWITHSGINDLAWGPGYTSFSLA